MDKFKRLTSEREWIEGATYRKVLSCYQSKKRTTIKVEKDTVYRCVEVRTAVNSMGGNNRPGWVKLRCNDTDHCLSREEWYKHYIEESRPRWIGEPDWLTHTYSTCFAKGCSITLEGRPHYCDRGNYLAKLHVSDPRTVHVDGQDLWPRFYFDLERAKAECEAWLNKRGLLPVEGDQPNGGDK